MLTEKLYTAITLAIIFVLLYLLYKIISPFLTPIMWAIVLSIIFYPLYKLFLRFLKYPRIASIITLILILILIIGPAVYLVALLIGEITGLYRLIEERGLVTLTKVQEHPMFLKVQQTLSPYIPMEDLDLRNTVIKALKSLAVGIDRHISAFFRDIILFVVGFIIMCLSIFFFLKDGGLFLSYIERLFPFSESHRAILTDRIKDMIVAVIYGGVVVALIQGIIGGVAFMVLGLPAPVFWGTVIAVLSFIPFFGPTIIWAPAGIILILGGSYGKGIGILLVGIFIISVGENILKPLIIGERVKLPMLFIFFSALGGIILFGVIGFILGPLILALCLSLLEIYKYEETA